MRKGLSDRELQHLETLASIKEETRRSRAIALATMWQNIAPPTYTGIIALAMLTDCQYGMAAVVASSLALSWAFSAKTKPNDDA